MRDLRWWVFIPFCIVAYQALKGKTSTYTRQTWFMIYTGLSCVFFVSAITKFLAFEVNGVDFSSFDWMLHNSISGKFMWSPFCNCNHFGVHPTWLLLGLIPIHFLWSSPWLLVITHAASLAAALPLLRRLTRQIVTNISDIHALLILSAFTVSSAIGSANNYGFHFETWYIPLGLWFLQTWLTSDSKWIIAAILIALLKEDGAIYLASWSLAALFYPAQRRRALPLVVASAVFFLLNTKLLQPLAWSDSTFSPSWAMFWPKYGHTSAEVLRSALLNPGMAFEDIALSGIWTWLLPFAFAPLISVQAVAGLAPGVFMLGLSSTPLLRGFSVYYATPMIPFAIYGWLKLVGRFKEFVSPTLFQKFLIAFVFLIGFVGGVGPKLGKMNAKATQDVEVWLNGDAAHLSPRANVCIQTALYPHMGYINGIQPLLTNDCADGAVIHSDLDPYPFRNKEELLTQSRAHGWLDLAQRNTQAKSE